MIQKDGPASPAQTSYKLREEINYFTPWTLTIDQLLLSYCRTIGSRMATCITQDQ